MNLGSFNLITKEKYVCKVDSKAKKRFIEEYFLNIWMTWRVPTWKEFRKVCTMDSKMKEGNLPVSSLMKREARNLLNVCEIGNNYFKFTLELQCLPFHRNWIALPYKQHKNILKRTLVLIELPVSSAKCGKSWNHISQLCIAIWLWEKCKQLNKRMKMKNFTIILIYDFFSLSFSVLYHWNIWINVHKKYKISLIFFRITSFRQCDLI